MFSSPSFNPTPSKNSEIQHGDLFSSPLPCHKEGGSKFELIWNQIQKIRVRFIWNFKPLSHLIPFLYKDLSPCIWCMIFFGGFLGLACERESSLEVWIWEREEKKKGSQRKKKDSSSLAHRKKCSSLVREKRKGLEKLIQSIINSHSPLPRLGGSKEIRREGPNQSSSAA